jgi:hypothetical protein
LMEKLVVIRFNKWSIGYTYEIDSVKYENNIQLPAILIYCIHELEGYRGQTHIVEYVMDLIENDICCARENCY